MKIYNKVGSKERFLEMFQRVNKINLNEDFNNGGVDVNSILSNGFNALKNGQLSIQSGGGNDTTVQLNDNESTIEIKGVDKNRNSYKFVFSVTYNEGDQDGVYDMDSVTLNDFEYRSSDGSQTFELDESGLMEFNQQYGGDLFDVVQNFVDVKSPSSDVDIDGLEEAVKLIDAIKKDSYPFGGYTDKMQTGKAYADEKPTNPALRVKSPQLDKVLNEEDTDKKEKNDYPDSIGKKFKTKKQYKSGKKKSQSVVNISESTDRDKYENVVFLQGDEAYEPLERLDREGEDAALEYLKQWHYPGEHEGSTKLSHGSSDETYEKDGYIMSWNPRIGYIGLQYDLSNLNENDDYDDNQTDNGYNPDELPPEYDGNFNFDDDEEDDLNPEPEISDDYTEEDEKFTMQAYNNLMSANSRKSNYSPTSYEIQQEIRKLKGITNEPERDSNSLMAAGKSRVYPNWADKYLGEDFDKLEGGLADDKSPAEFDPKQIQLGIGVEMEHTSDPKVAIEIVLDHLTEDPQYYTIKDDPEASAQFNASKDADEMSQVEKDNPMLYPDGWKELDGMFMNPNNPMYKKLHGAGDDKEMTDLLLGYKPKNVGDVDEEFIGTGTNSQGSVEGEEVTDDKEEEFIKKYRDMPDDKQEELLNVVNTINESVIKKARQALNNRGIVEGMTKKEAVQILIKHNIK